MYCTNAEKKNQKVETKSGVQMQIYVCKLYFFNKHPHAMKKIFNFLSEIELIKLAYINIRCIK